MRIFVTTALSAGLLAALMPVARAGELTLVLNGVFNGDFGTADAISGIPFAANTPFTISGSFDTTSRSLLPPVPVFGGFVAYAPSSVTLAVNGVTYDVATYTASPSLGLSVAIFDSTSIFGPGHYAAGFIQNPVADGAGIVGDWSSATPPFTVTSLGATSFPASAFFGVGFTSGICLMPDGMGGCNNNDYLDTPIPLSRGGVSYALSLGSYDLNSPSNGLPNPTEFAFSATVVPEPASMALLATGLAGFGLARRRAAR